MESIPPSVQDQVEKDVRKHKYWTLIAEVLPCDSALRIRHSALRTQGLRAFAPEALLAILGHTV